jgi:hypothetical protein
MRIGRPIPTCLLLTTGRGRVSRNMRAWAPSSPECGGVSAVLPRPMKGLVILVFCVETNPFEQQNRQHTGRVAPGAFVAIVVCVYCSPSSSSVRRHMSEVEQARRGGSCGNTCSWAVPTLMGSLMRSTSSAITPGSNHRCRPSQVLHAPYRCVPELRWRPCQVPFEQRLGGAQHRCPRLRAPRAWRRRSRSLPRHQSALRRRHGQEEPCWAWRRQHH